MRKCVLPILILALAAFITSSAMAQDSKSGDQQKRGRPGGPPVIMGKITAIGEQRMTIKPEVPERIRERIADRGRGLPELPESITIKLTDDTKWILDGDKASWKEFSVGDEVVVKLIRPKGQAGAEGKSKTKVQGKKAEKPTPVAEIVADPESAKQFIKDKLRERKGNRGEGDGGPGMGDGGDGPQGGWGPGGQEDGAPFPPGPDGRQGAPGFGFGPEDGAEPGMGPDAGFPGPGPFARGGPGMGTDGPGGMPGRPGMHRPAIGKIISMDRKSITIKPQLPDFVADKLKERDMPLPEDLPEKLVFKVSDETVFIDAGEELEHNPFDEGDVVVVMLAPGEDDQPVARAVVDIKSAREKMQQMMEQRRDGNRNGEEGGRMRKRDGTCQEDGQPEAPPRRNPR